MATRYEMLAVHFFETIQLAMSRMYLQRLPLATALRTKVVSSIRGNFEV